MQARVASIVNFGTILIMGTATGLLLALVVLRFVSGSLLVAMGDACGGIFKAGHGFLAASNWNYLLETAVAAVFILQLAFLVGGGLRLLKVSHGEKARRHGASVSCPALVALARKTWASHLIVIPGDDRLQAQTVGLMKPRILVSEGLAHALNREELEAVLEHEEAHRAARDNLFLVMAKSVTLTLFYLPGARLAFREMCTGLERAADLRASEKSGGRLAVAGALARIATLTRSENTNASALSTAVTGNSGLTSRLEELVQRNGSPMPCRRRLLLFATGTAAALTIFASSAYAVAGRDQREAFICFTQHEQNANADGVCELDHPDHP